MSWPRSPLVLGGAPQVAPRPRVASLRCASRGEPFVGALWCWSTYPLLCAHSLLARLAPAMATTRAARGGGGGAAGVVCATCRGATRRAPPSGGDSGLPFSYAGLVAPSGECVGPIQPCARPPPPPGRYPALCDVVTLTSALHASLGVLFAGCDYREDYQCY